MAWWLILFVMCIYATIAVMEFTNGNIPMAITFAGYAFSNVGLAWLSLKGIS